MQLKRIGPLSLARLAVGLYGAIGIVIGVIFAAAALVGSGLAGAEDQSSPVFGFAFGFGAIVFFPLLYGVLGGLGALVVAGLYNVFASLLGGVELTLE
jgi:hypothetical protein